ncbi:MAG: ammonia-forming cytochrome c nitrite reductase [Verrucomicrobia bacterium]|nr:ammonia-forming cytochrome c nitrite reductase [Verrucomicrobiota bacterium]
MKSIAQVVREKPWAGWLLFAATLVAVFGLGLLLSTIIMHRAEKRQPFEMIVRVRELEPRSAIWGTNFPREYETYLETKDTSFRSKYNGSVPRDMLEEDPRWVVLWAGYAFSKDYLQSRGHAWAIEDIRTTLRTNSGMPGTCWTCKSPDVPRVIAERGAAEFYRAEWDDLGAEIVNPIGCADCHDHETMNLVITRPALVEAFERRGEDIAAATHQEMRALVCAQCHVEYYFRGEGMYLTLPWDKGRTVEAMEAYYDEYDFADWVHPLSRAKMVKAQHPDWELFETGIHAQRGLACADCHMPYLVEGGIKYSSHHVVSPLAMIPRTCVVCHREGEDELRKNVYERQDKVMELRNAALDAIVAAHFEAKAAWDAGATEDEMAPILVLIRHAQWRCDFVAASHGAPFHTPIESARILSSARKKADEARLHLARILMAHGVTEPVEIPDISTKAKAQAAIGLDMEAERARKAEFLKTVVPQWDAEAAARERKWDEESED